MSDKLDHVVEKMLKYKKSLELILEIEKKFLIYQEVLSTPLPANFNDIDRMVGYGTSLSRDKAEDINEIVQDIVREMRNGIDVLSTDFIIESLARIDLDASMICLNGQFYFTIAPITDDVLSRKLPTFLSVKGALGALLQQIYIDT